LIVTVSPAAVSVPVLALPVFGRTVNVTFPAPVPLAPVTIVIQAALLCAVHAQPPEVDTAIGLPPPPAAAIDSLVGFTE
jgi:hypothetical protein